MKPLPSHDQLTEQITRLGDRYRADNQHMSSYLDGLLQARYLTYWDYISQNALLNLQAPRTAVPDEMIFIIYHQISELYFKLILWEIEQLIEPKIVTDRTFLEKIERINRYYENLIYSFDIMTKGMDKAEFIKFRTALTPASGFQSVQYRLIEIYSTNLRNLIKPAHPALDRADDPDLYANLYWKRGATDLATGQKDISLLDFERQYDDFLRGKAVKHADNNLWTTYQNRFAQSIVTADIQSAMRRMDSLANVQWPLAHLKTATKFLRQGRDTLLATGGTNWKQYLPPSYQQVIFFPDLWTYEEVENWGKTQLLELFQQAA